MTSKGAKSKRRLLGPLLLLFGFLWILAAEQGLLPLALSPQHGLMVAASGSVIFGLQGIRSGRRPLFFPAILVAGGALFAGQIYYLAGDYRKFSETAPLRALLPGYEGDILTKIVVVSVMFLASCFFGILRGGSRSDTGSGHKTGRNRRSPRTAPVKTSRTVRSMQR